MHGYVGSVYPVLVFDAVCLSERESVLCRFDPECPVFVDHVSEWGGFPYFFSEWGSGEDEVVGDGQDVFAAYFLRQHDCGAVVCWCPVGVPLCEHDSEHEDVGLASVDLV